ncbi:thioredoxin domain-containing protein [Pedobacter sp. SL55]|uniref:thioredoxin domain-containing protein n=1 Tax=Pedobacter sp. SL55 TaxID=2995161 RepID=UPI002271760A|nr:thioredoxin domain-containing protein [Pedobacter sp. SL55]WAC42442.1 thioredoxin domain-containing protein [Pedobacter sp. SL55]
MYKSIFICVAAIILASYSYAQTTPTITSVSATELTKQLEKEHHIQLLDVRTPSEFKNGHIQNAINANINDKHFEDKIAALDKTKPVYVYCLSGGRSKIAVKQLSAVGFKNIVEMPGGMMEWRTNNLPETKDTNATATKGMTLAQYEKLLKSDKMVLIDFYADWCIPCKKMKPYLDKIAKDMANKVVIVRIDADANIDLCKNLKIEALPVLKLYKNEKLVWDNLGFVEETTVRKQLK